MNYRSVAVENWPYKQYKPYMLNPELAAQQQCGWASFQLRSPLPPLFQDWLGRGFKYQGKRAWMLLDF